MRESKDVPLKEKKGMLQRMNDQQKNQKIDKGYRNGNR